MPKREAYIRIRLFNKEKELWEKHAKENKFPSLASFIRYIVSETIEHGLTSILKQENNKNSTTKRDELNLLKEQYKKQEKLIEQYMKKLDDLIKERVKSEDIKVEHGLKGKILKWIEKFNGKLRSEDIAEIVGVTEPDILDILNKMQEQKLIKLNRRMTYEMISNANNK